MNHMNISPKVHPLPFSTCEKNIFIPTIHNPRLSNFG
jgi:hypothetical protein